MSENTPSCKCGETNPAEFGKSTTICKACVNKKFGRETTRPHGGESRAVERKERIPLTEKRVLDYRNADPNFEYRYVNDMKGRVERFLDGGWEVVTDADKNAGNDANNVRGRLPGTAVVMAVGEGLNAVLMRKPKDLFEQDMALARDRVDEIESSIFTNTNKDNFYQPRGTKNVLNTVQSVRDAGNGD